MPSTFTFTSSGWLKRLADSLEQAPQAIRAEAARRVERRLAAVLEGQFARVEDPYGRPYQPPKDGHAPPMTRSGALRRGLRVRVDPSQSGLSLRVLSDQDYARYLQEGTRRMAARKIVPDQHVLAPEWRKVIEEAYREAFGVWYGQAKPPSG